MAILSPTNLETLADRQSGWDKVFNKDFELLAQALLAIRLFPDVLITGAEPPDASVLVWESASSKWKPRVWS